MITRLAKEWDIDEILRLQALNLYTNLPKDELSQGFVTTLITDTQIKLAIALQGVFVAENENAIVGYAYAADWDYFSQWSIFPYMVSRFPQLQFNDCQITTDNTFQYGPVCIDRTLRGKGIFPQLFATMRSNLANRFPIGLTFINQINKRSLVAHQKLNLAIIDEFKFNNSFYYTLAFFTS